MNASPQKLSDAEIDQLRMQADLVGYISQRVALKKAPNGEFIGPCPFHKETTPSFYVVPRKGIYHCFGCKVTGDIFRWLRETKGISFGEAIAELKGAEVLAKKEFKPSTARLKDDRAERMKKIGWAWKIWEKTIPAAGTLVEMYLRARGLGGVEIPNCIRFSSKLWNSEKECPMPAMVTMISDPVGGFCGIHRTYLKPDGSSKADLKYAKMGLGAWQGGYARLFDAGSKLAIGEGIETMLSIRKSCPDVPVWAALSLGNMGAPVPKEVKELIVCEDGDNKDPDQAEKVFLNRCGRHTMPGRVIRRARPPEGYDFNDLLQEQQAAAEAFEKEEDFYAI
jgi:hypothetical protein